MLTVSEQSRAADFLLEIDRRAFIIGRAALRVLLCAYLERAPGDVLLSHTALGKPHVPSAHNGHGIEFSVSHSGGRILFAIARERAVGVDVERVRPLAHPGSLARAMLTPDEWIAWSGLAHSQRVDALFATWTRKEAVLKALGCGLALRPSTLDVTRERGELRDMGSSWWLGNVRQKSGWAAALALEGAADARIVWATLHKSDTSYRARSLAINRSMLATV
jgi:4'-phosphopantetheinyl transferase